VAEQFKSTSKSKLVFTDNPGNGKYHCEAGAPEGREPDTRCCAMERVPLWNFISKSRPFSTAENRDVEGSYEYLKIRIKRY
jgi:hypothetical protein